MASRAGRAKRASVRRPGNKSRGGSKRGGWKLRLAAVLLGLTLGAGLVGWVLWKDAIRRVDDAISGPGPWDRANGRVLSAPVEVWPGLALTPSELAEDLQRAGYARVAEAKHQGDFSVSGDAVMVAVAEANGPGWEVPAGDVLVTFRDGRVRSVSPGKRARFAPSELAGVHEGEGVAREPVKLADLPEDLVHAVLAIEDARFWEHAGLDPVGIARALAVDAWRGEAAQGGSTITQQLAKNLFTGGERTASRKAREALLALALEERLSKEEVLELYLNAIYLGQDGGVAVRGVGQAARAWFGKPAERLSLGEAATVAGSIASPNGFAPLRHPEKAERRRNVVLDRMVATGWLDPAKAETEKAAPLVTHPGVLGRRARWAVDAAIEKVEEGIGEAGGVAGSALVVHTAIQPALQRSAERAVAEGATELDRARPKSAGAEMALVAVRVSDGAVVAVVGGRDYARSQFDRALHSARQVGSTIKGLTLLVAFDADPDLSPATTLDDAPIERVVDGKVWRPKNYDGGFVGPITVRRTIADSRNVPAVLLAERVGMGLLERRWRAAGLSRATSFPSAALGSFDATPVELAAAYAVVARGGTARTHWLVRAAVGPDGDLVWKGDASSSRSPRKNEERIAAPRAAFLATSVLEEVVRTGTGHRAGTYGLTGGIAGKTGTTDDGRDAWFVGFTPEIAAAVWVGFDRDRALGLTGADAALPTWARFMAATGTARGGWSPPATVAQATLCKESNAPAVPACPETFTEYFTVGTVPVAVCPIHAAPLRVASDQVENIGQRIGRGIFRLFGAGKRDTGGTAPVP